MRRINAGKPRRRGDLLRETDPLAVHLLIQILRRILCFSGRNIKGKKILERLKVERIEVQLRVPVSITDTHPEKEAAAN